MKIFSSLGRLDMARFPRYPTLRVRSEERTPFRCRETRQRCVTPVLRSKSKRQLVSSCLSEALNLNYSVRKKERLTLDEVIKKAIKIYHFIA
ncbi:MAG: hypothetical protein F6K48_17575 [Okeania sp. SIO3H1]|nr:hypothetical protein [Okeania sp. SIO3H1]